MNLYPSGITTTATLHTIIVYTIKRVNKVKLLKLDIY